MSVSKNYEIVKTIRLIYDTVYLQIEKSQRKIKQLHLRFSKSPYLERYLREKNERLFDLYDKEAMIIILTYETLTYRDLPRAVQRIIDYSSLY